MTVLGVAVGVSLFVSLTSISDGFKSQLQDIVRGYSIDIVVTSKRGGHSFWLKDILCGVCCPPENRRD